MIRSAMKLIKRRIAEHVNKLIATAMVCTACIMHPETVIAAGDTGLLSIKSCGGSQLEISWDIVPGSDGYRIYRATAYHGAYSLLKDSQTNQFIDVVGPGTRYYYKVRAYQMVNGKKSYGKYSSVKTGYIKAKGVPTSTPVREISKLKVSGSQLIVVSVENKSTTKANVSFYTKTKNGNWIIDFSTIGYIGKNGLGKTREGDKKTPAGLFRFTAAFGIAAEPENVGIPYVQVNDTHWVVSDSDSEYYNRFVTTAKNGDGYMQTLEAAQDWNAAEGEQLYQYTQCYQYSLILNYNPENIPGEGSAIFLHCYSDNQYTGGCIAVPEARMKYLLQQLAFADNEITASIIIDTADKIGTY